MATAKASTVMSIGTTLSRITGLIRIAALVAIFGRNFTTDAYNISNTMPNMIYELVAGGILSSLFIPTFVEFLANDKEDEAWHVASSITNISLILLGATAILGVVGSKFLVSLQVHGFEMKYFLLASTMFKIFAPQLVFYGIVAISTGILNSYRHFAAPAFAPVANNIIVIVSTFTLGTRFGILGLAVGTTLGVAGMALFQVPAMIKRGFKYKLVLDLQHPAIRKLGWISLPILVYVASNQFALTIQNNIASYFKGGITSIQAVMPLQQLSYGIFAVSITTALFPILSENVVKGDLEEYRKTISQGVRFIGLILIPAAVGSMALALPIIRLIYERGHFDFGDSLATAPVLFYYVFGIFSFSIQMFFTRGFYSMKDTITPMKVNLIWVPTNVAANYLLSRFMGVSGIALGYTIAYSASAVFLGYLLRKRIGGIDGKRVTSSLAKIAMSALVMGFSVHYSAAYFSKFLNLESLSGRLYLVLFGVTIGAIVYGGAITLLKVQEASAIKKLVSEKVIGRFYPV